MASLHELEESKRKAIFWSVFVGSCIVAGIVFLFVTKTRLEKIDTNKLIPQFNAGQPTQTE
ncbi:MAG: hypothetical protein Q7S63_00950 [bacterium]|nr:hypothetical protein [bacterium]